MSEVVVTVSEFDVVVGVSETLAVIEVGNSGPQGPAGATGATGATGPKGDSYTPGDPIYVTVRNNTGSTLTKGQVVYTNGATGGKVTVALARADADSTSARTLGWVSADIANNADGLIQIEGLLSGVDTQGLSDGAIVYLSGITAGGFTTTKPVAPIHLVYLGVVAKAASANGGGAVLVKVQNGYELDEIHDVLITSPTDNQVLTFESASGLWKNKTNTVDGVQSVVFSSPLTGGTVTSAGTVGLDQSVLSLTQSQVANLTTDLAAKTSFTNLSDYVSALLSMPTTAVETYSRRYSNTANYTITSGSTSWTMFTPMFNLTVSTINIWSGAAALTGATAVQLGLYTFDDATNTATLVARTANDTTLLAATSTSYTSVFSTAGGYPATYSLVAGQRYAVAIYLAGSNSPQLQGSSTGHTSALGLALKPLLGATRSSSALPTPNNTWSTYVGGFYARLF